MARTASSERAARGVRAMRPMMTSTVQKTVKVKVGKRPRGHPDAPYSCSYTASRCACGRKKSADFGACWLCANGAVAEHLGLLAKLPRAPYRAPSFGAIGDRDHCLCGASKSCDFEECYECKAPH